VRSANQFALRIAADRVRNRANHLAGRVAAFRFLGVKVNLDQLREIDSVTNHFIDGGNVGAVIRLRHTFQED